MNAPTGFGEALDDEGRRELAALGRLRRFASGTALFHEGDRSAHVFVIRSGRVKITAGSSEGHELVLALRGADSLVGELAGLMEGAPRRSATAVAMSSVVAQTIPNEDFTAFLGRHPGALLALTRTIVARLHDADRRRAEFGAYDTLGRLARVLLELVAATATPRAVAVPVDPPLTQHELAGLVGASRESVVRALAELRRRGVVQTGRRRLVVRDVDMLAAVAHERAPG